MLILEPLAQQIREDPNIKEITIGNTTHKIALYADDILWFLINPDTSLKALLNLIDGFSSFSGYKINWTKSELLTISTPGFSTRTLYPLARLAPTGGPLNYLKLCWCFTLSLSLWIPS